MKVVAAVLLLAGYAMALNVSAGQCPNVTVVHSVGVDNWYDGCMGLTKNVNATTEETCKANCYANPFCSVWQLVKGTDGTLKCWSGSVVHDCLDGRSDQAQFSKDLVAGERIQHGFIKIVKENDGYETLGLKNFPEDTGDEPAKIERCKRFCETDVTCTIWEYGKTGCWMEHLPTNPAGVVKANSTFAQSCVAGQTIEHTCPPYEAPEEGLPWPWIITGIIVGLLAIGTIIYFLTQKEPKVKKTRAVKIEEKPEPPPVATYFVPQPTVLIPQQSVVMAAPSMVMAAPMQTVQTVQMAVPMAGQTMPLMGGYR